MPFWIVFNLLNRNLHSTSFYQRMLKNHVRFLFVPLYSVSAKYTFGLENFVNFSRSHRRIVRWCHKLKKKLAVSIHHLNFSEMTQGTKDSINISQHHTVIQNLLFSSYFNRSNIFHASKVHLECNVNCTSAKKCSRNTFKNGTQ